MRLVVKLGGALFPSDLDTARLSPFVALLKDLHKSGNRVLVVTGGGPGARRYIDASRKLGGSEAFSDDMGIMVTKLNAKLLACALGEDAYQSVPNDFADLQKGLQSGRVVVAGGLVPGQSTNAVAALAAEAMKADLLINVTDVDGVYDKDPKKHKNARRLSRVSPSQLLKIALSAGSQAGTYELLDPVALRIIQRSKIPTWFVSWKDLDNIRSIVSGRGVGTQVVYE